MSALANNIPLKEVDCKSITEDAQRLNCFDRNYSTPHPDAIVEEPDWGRLSANKPNYFVYVSPYDNSKIKDEPHGEFFLSIKYPLIDHNFYHAKYNDNDEHKSNWHRLFPDRLYLVYNGLYDFYFLDSNESSTFNRYNSSPILSRIQNPGIDFEWHASINQLQKLRLGWYHESNGQTESPLDKDLFQLDTNEKGTDYALAKISRGWDYGSLSYSISSHDTLMEFAPDWYRFNIELRAFCDCQAIGLHEKEDSIWWESGNNSKISDFDGIRISAEKSFIFNPAKPQLGTIAIQPRIELKAGSSSVDKLSNLSGKFSLNSKVGNTHFTMFYFEGYGKETSSYHLKTSYSGIGIEIR